MLLGPIELLKLKILARGVGLSEGARTVLSGHGTRQYAIREYATTGGITMVLPGDIWVNAPVDEWYCDDPAAQLDWEAGRFIVCGERNATYNVRVLPQPRYLGGEYPDGVMTHADRVRLSPIDGCACSCAFCDSPFSSYRLRGSAGLLAGLVTAVKDVSLPARHALISGGTPRPRDEGRLDELYEAIIQSSLLPVDVMLMPRADESIVDRLVAAGAAGFSINLEVFSPDAAARLTPQKEYLGHDGYARMWDRAVSLLGRGKVRSLLLVGLEDPDDVLQGVEFIASHGVDPVLSPFRPASGTELADVRPPDAELMEYLYVESREIVARYGVALGPRCIPCQHNTIAFPESGGDYYFS